MDNTNGEQQVFTGNDVGDLTQILGEVGENSMTLTGNEPRATGYKGHGYQASITIPEDLPNPKPRDVMIDLETIDSSGTSAIASIGACVFDKDGIYHTFYAVVDSATCVRLGMTQSEQTLKWWSEQSEEARTIFAPETPKIHIADALGEFTAWYEAVGGKELWGNGSDFDNAIMSHAYRMVGVKQPWSYGSNRCFRTIKNGAYMEKRTGVHHNALDDAVTQAQYMIDKGLVPPR